jgi:hypothetical protein
VRAQERFTFSGLVFQSDPDRNRRKPQCHRYAEMKRELEREMHTDSSTYTHIPCEANSYFLSSLLKRKWRRKTKQMTMRQEKKKKKQWSLAQTSRQAQIRTVLAPRSGDTPPRHPTPVWTFALPDRPSRTTRSGHDATHPRCRFLGWLQIHMCVSEYECVCARVRRRMSSVCVCACVCRYVRV